MVALVIALLILLLLSVIAAIVIYFSLNKNLNYYKTISKDVSTMNIIQRMFDIMGTNLNANEKIVKLNNAILESYAPRYSTISIFDGNQYEIKATNVEDTFKESVAGLAEANDFKANASKNVSKYLTTTMAKTLTYKSALERQIRSAMFSPIYYNNMYLGFWLLEDSSENAFDHISKDELAKLKNNMGVFLENVQFQDTIEIAENTDKQTGYFNNMYLYSNTRQLLTSNDTTALTLICLKNIPDINEKYTRNIGNSLLIKIANLLKDTVTNDALLIRYSGLRFLMITPSSNAEVVQPIMERFLSRIKNEYEFVQDEKISVETQILIHTFKKQNNIEKEIQKMVSYIDNMKDINTIKII